MEKTEIKNEQHRLESGRLKVLERINRKLYRVEIWALNNKTNRNGWRYINLESHLDEFQDIPILTAYLKDGAVIGDGHNYDMKIDPRTGEEYASFTAADAERIVGWVPKDASIRLEREEDTDWIVVTGYLWTWYARELVEKIAGQGGGMEVSVETLVTREHKEGDVDVEESYVILGITVLGDGVAPAVAGANIQSLAALRSCMEKEILKAASYINEPDKPENPNNHDRKVKTNMYFSARELGEMSKNFPGYTCVGLSEDGKKVALLSAQGVPAVYVFSDSDKGNVIGERIRSASARLTFTTEDGEAEANFETALNVHAAENAALKADKEKLESENKTMSAKLEAMEKRECERRLDEAKNAVKTALERENALLREGTAPFSDELCKDLMARIEAGEFSKQEDAAGKWIGCEAIRREMGYIINEEKNRRAAADKAKEDRYFKWDWDGAKGNESAGTIGERVRANAARD